MSKKTHGMSRTNTYKSWRNMKKRCSNRMRHNFKSYGGIGIKVCERWVNSFENFFADMGERPVGTHIGRIDHTKDYEPNNCRWTTPRQEYADKYAQATV